MSMKLSFKEALARRASTAEKSRARSVSPTAKMLLSAGDIAQPVDLVRILRSHGLSLRKAHDTLNRLALGESVAVELSSDNSETVIPDLAQMGVTAAHIVPPVADVRLVRESFGLSQDEFATRFGFEASTVRNWEQGRNKPDPAVQLLLKIIETEPGVVEKILTQQVGITLPPAAARSAPASRRGRKARSNASTPQARGRRTPGGRPGS
jgi:DNA-binding transcriptional regulator YiaG